MAIEKDFSWIEIGERIRSRRTSQSKTQQQVATAAGLTQNAVFRLEAGDTNPQIETLRKVAKALDVTIRELVCGPSAQDSTDRMNHVQRIVGSGDAAAIQTLDRGIETALTLLERAGGSWTRTPSQIRLGNRVYARRVSSVHQPLDNGKTLQPSKSVAKLIPSLKGRDLSKEEIEAMIGVGISDAPPLPVGNARKQALPDTRRLKEHHVKPLNPTAFEHSQSHKP